MLNDDRQGSFAWRFFPDRFEDSVWPEVAPISEALQRQYPNRIMIEHSCARCAQGFSSVKRSPKYCSQECFHAAADEDLGIGAAERNRDPVFRAKFMAARSAAGYPDPNRPEAVARRKMRSAAKNAIHRCLKRQGKTKDQKAAALLGYSTREFLSHIDGLLNDGMTWENYGLWEIDHKRPIASFPIETPLSVVNALSNLRPLWKAANRSKRDKYDQI